MDASAPELEPLVMIPGMMSDARVFAPQLAAFSGFMPVMVAPPVGGDTVEEIAAQMAPQLPMRFALVGLGLGGLIAMELLRRHSDRITRLCLMSVSAQPETPADSSEREPHIIGARTGRLEEAVRSVVQPDLLAPVSARLELAQSLIDMGMDMGGELFVSQSRAMQRSADMQSALRRCHGPARVLRGEYDRRVPAKHQSFVAALLPKGELVEVPRASHYPGLENAQLVNQVLAEWLSQPL